MVALAGYRLPNLSAAAAASPAHDSAGNVSASFRGSDPSRADMTEIPGLSDDPHARSANFFLSLGFSNDARKELNYLSEGVPVDAPRKRIVDYIKAIGSSGDYRRAMQLARRYLKAHYGMPMPQKGIDGYRDVWEIIYPRAYWKSLKEAGKEFDVSPLLLAAIMREESTYRPDVRSPAGAIGLMQIMPATGRRIAVHLGERKFRRYMLAQPQTNIRFGAWYVNQLLQKFNNQEPLAIGGYNAGPMAVVKWLEHDGDRDLDEWVEQISYRETRNYVKKVLRSYGIYMSLYTTTENDFLRLPKKLDATYRENISF